VVLINPGVLTTGRVDDSPAARGVGGHQTQGEPAHQVNGPIKAQ
jgi:hypothetical protein